MTKNIWVLSIRTSLPDYCYDVSSLNTRIFSFETFEEARFAFRKIIRYYAFSDNTMFDGTGHLCNFDEYSQSSDDDTEATDDELSKKRLDYIRDLLYCIFDGKDTTPTDFRKCDDGLVFCTYEDGVFHMRGDEDGPMNGYNPTIKTNMFSLEKEQKYFLYIDDLFGQEISSELYIDLYPAETFNECEFAPEND